MTTWSLRDVIDQNCAWTFYDTKISNINSKCMERHSIPQPRPIPVTIPLKHIVWEKKHKHNMLESMRLNLVLVNLSCSLKCKHSKLSIYNYWEKKIYCLKDVVNRICQLPLLMFNVEICSADSLILPPLKEASSLTVPLSVLALEAQVHTRTACAGRRATMRTTPLGIVLVILHVTLCSSQSGTAIL